MAIAFSAVARSLSARSSWLVNYHHFIFYFNLYFVDTPHHFVCVCFASFHFRIMPCDDLLLQFLKRFKLTRQKSNKNNNVNGQTCVMCKATVCVRVCVCVCDVRCLVNLAKAATTGWPGDEPVNGGLSQMVSYVACMH